MKHNAKYDILSIPENSRQEIRGPASVSRELSSGIPYHYPTMTRTVPYTLYRDNRIFGPFRRVESQGSPTYPFINMHLREEHPYENKILPYPDVRRWNKSER